MTIAPTLTESTCGQIVFLSKHTVASAGVSCQPLELTPG